VYIEINLLPRSFRPKKRLVSIDVRSAVTLVITVAAIGLGYYYYSLRNDVSAMTSQIAGLKQQEQQIKFILDLEAEVKTLRDDITERVDIIKSITSDSDIRFELLNHINTVMPENLWLQSITEQPQAQGASISFNIEGMSYSKEDISAFLAGLEQFENANTVALESITPAPLEIRDAFKYVVRVDLKSSQPPTEPAAAKRPAGRAARR